MISAAGPSALAAEPDGPAACGIKAAVWGDYQYARADFSDTGGGSATIHGPSGTLTGLPTCGSWNIQLASHGVANFSEGGRENGESYSAELEGMLFWPSLNVGLIGVFGGAGLSHFEFDDGDEAHCDSELYSAGIFAQHYADDTITLSIAGGIDWDLRNDKTFPNDIIEKTESWIVGASARHCVAPNFALALEGGYSESDFDEGALLTETISVGVGVEYLFDGSGLSVFGGGSGRFLQPGV